MGFNGGSDSLVTTRRGFMEVGNSRQPAVSVWPSQSEQCKNDSDCFLYAPLCLNGRCSIHGLNVSMGRCTCSRNDAICNKRILVAKQNTTATACFVECSRNSACAAVEKRYINDSDESVCTLFGFKNVTNIRDTSASLTGDGENWAGCYAKPVLHSQCVLHPLCAREALEGQEFCCPSREGIRLGCCASRSVDVSLFVTGILGVLLLCSCLCNMRQWCSPKREQALACRHHVESEAITFYLSEAGLSRSDSGALWDELENTTKRFIVFLNAGSGDQRGDGAMFKKIVDSLLAPDQDRDYGRSYMLPQQLNEGMEAAAEGLRNNEDIRILACGGDGTVTWILSTLDKKKDEFQGRTNGQWPPPVGIIPMGTGNDLARSLGWGAALTDQSELVDYVRRAIYAQPVELDQWKLTLTPNSFLPPALEATSTIPQFVGYFTNYFSIGMDAKTTFEVGEARSGKLGKCCFRNRCRKPCRSLHGGLCCYAANAPNIFRCCCCRTSALNSSEDGMMVELDGQSYPIPGEVRQFTFTNLNSYGAGMLLYDRETMTTVKPNDKKLEVFTRQGPWSVVGMTLAKKVLRSPCGSVHLAAQVESAKVTLKKGEFFQMDGEPWILSNGCEAEISHNGLVTMLCPLAEGPGQNRSGAGIFARSEDRSFWTRPASR
eukprot:TRINITY_DN77145_c0_g1_i1.p1 TRINITY_DN77145_c0_g1~~TRINITY_DN77145_c0_g1_i1.p1  ORF type:complete len:711 (+),score=87.05 TRINITY_DN77145_c0_g1_i1:156-2135(+)